MIKPAVRLRARRSRGLTLHCLFSVKLTVGSGTRHVLVRTDALPTSCDAARFNETFDLARTRRRNRHRASRHGDDVGRFLPSSAASSISILLTSMPFSCAIFTKLSAFLEDGQQRADGVQHDAQEGGGV
jgi:hypothetical protein